MHRIRRGACLSDLFFFFFFVVNNNIWTLKCILPDTKQQQGIKSFWVYPHPWPTSCPCPLMKYSFLIMRRWDRLLWILGGLLCESQLDLTSFSGVFSLFRGCRKYSFECQNWFSTFMKMMPKSFQGFRQEIWKIVSWAVSTILWLSDALVWILTQ